MNVVIPMGGLGERFAREGYRFPKPLVNIVGRPMIFWLLDNLQLTTDDRVYVALNDSMEHEFAIVDRLRTEYSSRPWTIEHTRLPFQTRGAAETVFVVLQGMTADRLSRKTISLDCDTLYFTDVLGLFRAAEPSMNASFYFNDSGTKPVFSYLQLDAQGEIKDIREKVPISNHANTGAYAFASGSLLRRFCAQLLDEAVGTAGEFYVSAIIKKMLDAGHAFKGIHVDSFSCVGTPWQLSVFLQSIARGEVKTGRKMRFVFDLDNTLVTHPRVSGDYSTCGPKPRNVQLVQELSAAGHYIIIWTARRMRTHKANVGAVIKDVGLITLQSLQQMAIPYDEVHFGKPYADLYVDDLAVNALVDTEKEIGWSCKPPAGGAAAAAPSGGMIPARSFNSVVVVDNTIIKSAKPDLIRGEIFFYRSLPESIRHLFPRVLDVQDGDDRPAASITMERLRGVTLSHLLTGRALTSGRLTRMMAALEAVHSCPPSGAAAEQPPLNIYANYADKVEARFKGHPSAYAPFQDGPYLCKFLVDHLREYERAGRGARVAFIHGDPVFSNILLTAANDVYFIDMRGRLGDTLTTAGDVLYDLAKVYQSLCGYDDIMLGSGLASDSGGKMQEDYLRKLRTEFRAHVRASPFYSSKLQLPAGLRDLEIITASLFFSLIPLHDEGAKIARYVEKCRMLIFSGTENAYDE